MKALTDTLARLPRWLMPAIAAVIAVVLMAEFVDTLQQHVRHGEEMRQAQRVSAVRQTISTVADARVATQTPQLR